MDKKFYRIDELSRGTLGDLEKDPPPMSFDKIRKRVFWYSFWSLSVGTFVKRFWGIPLAAAIVGVVVYQLIPAETVVSKGNTAFMEERPLFAPTNPMNDNRQIAGIAESENKSEKTNNNYFNIKTPAAENNDVKNLKKNQHPQGINLNDPYSIKTSGMLPASDILPEGSANPNDIANNQITGNQEPVTSNYSTQDFDIQPIYPINILSGLISQPTKPDGPICLLGSSEMDKGRRNISWSGFAGGGVVYSGSVFQPVSEDQPAVSRNFSLSASANLEVRADFGHWFLSSGFQQVSIDNRYAAEQLLYNERTSFEQTLTNEFWFVDSTGFWHYTFIADTTIHVVDSVWEWDSDSLLVQEFDSIAVQKFDTLNNASWKRNVRYLEIPLLVGKTFSYNRFIFGLSGGFGLGILYQSEGEYFSGETNGGAFSAFSVSETKKACFSMIAKGSISYLFNEHIAFELSPWYRRMLTPVGTGEPAGYKNPSSAGLSAGFRIFF